MPGRHVRLLIAGAILGAGLVTGNGIASTVASRTPLGAVYLAGVLAMAATFAVEGVLIALVLRIDRRIAHDPARSDRPIDLGALLAILALATLAAVALIRVITLLDVGSFVAWSRFLPAATLVIAMGLSLTVPASIRKASQRVIVLLFVAQLALTVAVRFL